MSKVFLHSNCTGRYLSFNVSNYLEIGWAITEYVYFFAYTDLLFGFGFFMLLIWFYMVSLIDCLFLMKLICVDFSIQASSCSLMQLSELFVSSDL